MTIEPEGGDGMDGARAGRARPRAAGDHAPGPRLINWRFAIPLVLNAAAVLVTIAAAKAGLTWLLTTFAP